MFFKKSFSCVEKLCQGLLDFSKNIQKYSVQQFFQTNILQDRERKKTLSCVIFITNVEDSFREGGGGQKTRMFLPHIGPTGTSGDRLYRKED
jgi:hypothetical protein